MCLNIRKSLRFFLAKNKPVREQITAVRGAARWRAEPRTPSWHRRVAPLQQSPAVGLIPAAGTNSGLMGVESSRERVQAQGQHQHRRFHSGASKELMAKSPGERASRGGEAGGFSPRSEVPGVSLLSLAGSLTSWGYGIEQDFKEAHKQKRASAGALWVSVLEQPSRSGEEKAARLHADVPDHCPGWPADLEQIVTSDFLKRVSFMFPE